MRIKKTFTTLSVVFLCGFLTFAQQNKSQWVYPDSNGKLTYKKTDRGDRIMDFSYAGYMGGGVAVPSVAVKIRVKPVEGDASQIIQDAVDKVSGMKLVNGFRGAVLLEKGVFKCSQPININQSGVVILGSGSGENGTVIRMEGKPHACFSVRGNVSVHTSGVPVKISDSYVPSGSVSFHVTDASSFKPGDTIRIRKPVTEKWVQFMGMDKLVRDGKKQTWISGEIPTEKVIRSVSGNEITVDVPLSDSYDLQYFETPGILVEKISTTGLIRQIGIENLRIMCQPQEVTINDAHHKGISLSGASDAWIRNLEIFNTVNSITVSAKRVTVENVSILHDKSTIGAAKPADFVANAPQVLFRDCKVTGDNLFFFATGARVSGPIVLLHCIFKGNGWIQPHQRWSTGLLVDGCEVPDGGIDFMNRGEMGSGHGWTIGWAVAWNCKAQSYLNQTPPGSANWVIGSTGEKQKRAMPFDSIPLLPEGTYDSHGSPVVPASLYLSQLSERMKKK